MGSAQSTRHAQLLRSGSLTDLVALRSSAGVKPGTSVPGMQSCEPRPRLEGALAVLASRGASAPSGRLLMVGARFPWAQAQGFMPALLRNAGWADSQAPTPRTPAQGPQPPQVLRHAQRSATHGRGAEQKRIAAHLPVQKSLDGAVQLRVAGCAWRHTTRLWLRPNTALWVGVAERLQLLRQLRRPGYGRSTRRRIRRTADCSQTCLRRERRGRQAR